MRVVSKEKITVIRWFKAFYFKKQFFKILLKKLFLGGKSTVSV